VPYTAMVTARGQALQPYQVQRQMEFQAGLYNAQNEPDIFGTLLGMGAQAGLGALMGPAAVPGMSALKGAGIGALGGAGLLPWL